MQTASCLSSMPFSLEQGKLPFQGFVLPSKQPEVSQRLKETSGANPFATLPKARFGLAGGSDRFEPASLRTAQCDAVALNLMLPYKDNLNGLLDRLQGMGVEVLNGSQLPWVDQYLASNGADAAFRLPGSSNSATAAAGSLSTASLGFAVPQIGTSPASVSLKPTDRFSLLIHSGPLKPDTLLHETYHYVSSAIEAAKASKHMTPPPKPVDAKSHAEAYQAWQRFSVKMRNPFFQLKLFFFTLPTLQKQLNKNDGASPWPASSTGLAIRDWMKQELDACNFVVKDGGRLGLTQADIVKNKARETLYDSFRMLSYQFDKQKFEQEQKAALHPSADLPQYAGSMSVSAFTPVWLGSSKPANKALIPALR